MTVRSKKAEATEAEILQESLKDLDQQMDNLANMSREALAARIDAFLIPLDELMPNGKRSSK